MSSALPSQRATSSFQRRLLRWFDLHGRKFPWRNNGASTYERIISEVLLQRTRAETVAKFYPAFLKSFASWKALANADEKTLQAYLQPIGLWRRRAITLVKLAQDMVKRRGILPRGRAEIEMLPGVGQYIANSIELFAHGLPAPLLDVNMARVIERHYGPRTLADIRYDPHLQQLSRRIVAGDQPIALNWALLDLAALICTPKKPSCSKCPLFRTCRYGKGTDQPPAEQTPVHLFRKHEGIKGRAISKSP